MGAALAEESAVRARLGPSNFKTWQCWGYSEDTCRAQVLKHLRNSGKHKEQVDKGESRDDVYVDLVSPGCISLIEDIYEAPPEQKKKSRTRRQPMPW